MKVALWHRLSVIGRLAVASIFLYAGYAKLREPWPQFAIAIDSFKAVPESWLEPMARLLPWCEVALGIMLLSGILARWFALIATLPLSLFLAAGIRAYAEGLTVDCGCFGVGTGGRIDAAWFVEHGAMVVLALVVATAYFLRIRRNGIK